ncbi:MAG: hypothetical protein C0598_01385 [Marinilabiliales bacterium]|nr:MAG: hypothetical protein C0598_01385 [Marinilabiliales bacterium]
MKTIQTIMLAALLIFVTACKKDDQDTPKQEPTIDISSYVAMGNSLTAGYADGALYKSGQNYSYAKIISQQMAQAGGNGIFKTPIINTEDGVYPSIEGSGLVLETKYVLSNTSMCDGSNKLLPVRAVENPDQGILMEELFKNISSEGPFNNLGVPGILVSHMLTPGMGSVNPYYGRFAENSSTDKLLDEAQKVNPTVFSLWVGNNDVLGYASSGGLSSITSVELFKVSYQAVVSYLSSITEGGVIANIPDISSAAFFTTIKYNEVVLENQQEIDNLNAHYSDYNQYMEDEGKNYRINFKEGMNAMVIKDGTMDVNAEYQIRQMNEDELALLSIPYDSLLCGDWGTYKALGNNYILTTDEIAETKSATETFNNLISQSASQYDLALVDFNSFMKDVAENGVSSNGVDFTTEFIYGNIFSLDGIHLTPQANALVANKFIDALNEKYFTSIPMVDVSTFPSVDIP